MNPQQMGLESKVAGKNLEATESLYYLLINNK